MLDSRGAIRGARVLDLFAGTGALGCEALSRGASTAVFVDRQGIALDTIRENLRRIDRLGVVVAGTLPGVAGSLDGGPWDLVFLDPPYADHLVPPTLAALSASGVLASGAFVVAEHSKDHRVDPEDLPSGLTWDTTRTYGGTCLSIWEAL